MNKRQREILGNRIASEEQILKELKNSYKEALKEIDDKVANLLGRLETEEGQINRKSIEYQLGYQKAMYGQISAILSNLNNKQFESISEYLQESYDDAFIGTMYDLQGQGIPIVAPMDQEQVVRAIKNNSKLSKDLWGSLADYTSELQTQIRAEISRGISQGSGYSRIARQLAERMNVGYNNTKRIVRTESHRISQEATLDAQKTAKEAGADIVKQWDASLDRRTRSQHARLDGQIAEVDEPFKYGGLEAMHPGGFGRPELDINCRCTILQRAKWALDEDELETLKQRAEYYGLDKTENFEDYKKKYIKSLDEIAKNSDNVGDIKVKIDQIKERIKKNGKATEADLQEAGQLIQDELNNSGLKEIKQRIEANNKERTENIQQQQKILNKIRKEYKDLPWEEYKKVLEEFKSTDKEWQKVEKEYKKLVDEINELNPKLNELEKNGVRNVLLKTRQLGLTEEQAKAFNSNVEVSEMTLNDDGQWARISPKDSKWLKDEGLKTLKKAYSYYPTEWLDESLNYNTLYIGKSKRGYYYHPGQYKGSSVLDLGKGGLSTAIHEMGHRFEYIMPKIKELEKEFYTRRTAGESLDWMGKGYGKNEKTRKDDFLNPYMGKDYGGRAYELVSMGFELAFTEPSKLAEDPDYANFIYGILTLL